MSCARIDRRTSSGSSPAAEAAGSTRAGRRARRAVPRVREQHGRGAVRHSPHVPGVGLAMEQASTRACASLSSRTAPGIAERSIRVGHLYEVPPRIRPLVGERDGALRHLSAAALARDLVRISPFSDRDERRHVAHAVVLGAAGALQ